MLYDLLPCKGRVGFVATPRNAYWLNLANQVGKLEQAGWRVEDRGVMIDLPGPPEMTLYKSGKLLVRTPDPDEATRAAHRVYEVLGLR